MVCHPCWQDLKDCADTIVGDELDGKKGLSGGQRRRLTIGIQLVRHDKLLFGVRSALICTSACRAAKDQCLHKPHEFGLVYCTRVFCSDRGKHGLLMQVRDPRLVFLDEPTSGLDSDMAMQVMDSLTQLSRRDRLVRNVCLKVYSLCRCR